MVADTMNCSKPATLFVLLIVALMVINFSVCAKEAIVHAVLFYSPSCPHCYKVIQEDLPPLFEKYGDQLYIIGINTQSIEGQEIYLAVVKYFELPPERMGVPTLVVGEIVLIGSLEIPLRFPSIVEEGLEEGGIDWSPITGLADTIATSITLATDQAKAATQATATVPNPMMDTNTPEATATAEPTAHLEVGIDTYEATSTIQAVTNPTLKAKEIQLPKPGSIVFDELLEDQSIAEKFMRDPIGNTSSVFVFTGMVISVIVVGLRLSTPSSSTNSWPRWVIPILTVVGLIVAGYLSFVEVTQTEAVCGPVGDCNTVQQSPYARLFGLIPVGLLGLMGYVAVIIAWGFQYYGPVGWRKHVGWVVWGMALVGTLYSIYLTFLEPFVIGATCAWCLTSAIVMTLILIAATSNAKLEWKARLSLTKP